MLQILFFAVVVCGCERKSSSTTEISNVQPQGARVVGFRFVLPGEDTPDMVRESGFSLIDRSGELNQGMLDELKVKESILTVEQVEQLNDAIYGEHPKTSSAACYDPHHIFVFYDEDDQIVNSIEICFSCLNINTSPELQETQWSKHDFRSLARLCDEIGIGMTSRTAEDLIQFWDETDRLGSKPNGG
jgi:hypothetical protein